LIGGVTFRFPPGTVIPARDALYVSPSLPAFRARTSGPRGNQGSLVVGPYAGSLTATESLQLLDGQDLRVAAVGGFGYLAMTTGNGDLTVQVLGAPPSGELFLLYSFDNRHPLGCGPLLGLGIDLLWTVGLPLHSHPFHVLTDAAGNYLFSAGPGSLPKGVDLDTRAVYLDPWSWQITQSRAIRLRL
jgi:hypothetical protein